MVVFLRFQLDGDLRSVYRKPTRSVCPFVRAELIAAFILNPPVGVMRGIIGP